MPRLLLTLMARAEAESMARLKAAQKATEGAESPACNEAERPSQEDFAGGDAPCTLWAQASPSGGDFSARPGGAGETPPVPLANAESESLAREEVEQQAQKEAAQKANAEAKVPKEAEQQELPPPPPFPLCYRPLRRMSPLVPLVSALSHPPHRLPVCP